MKKKDAIKDLVQTLKGSMDPKIVGESIAYSVFENRVANAKIYQKGYVKRFQNFESSALERALNFVNTNEEIDFEWNGNMTSLFHYKFDINRVNFVYDSIMFLHSKRVDHNQIYDFLGQKAFNVIPKQSPDGKKEYFQYLNAIKNDIVSRYHIIFD